MNSGVGAIATAVGDVRNSEESTAASSCGTVGEWPTRASPL